MIVRFIFVQRVRLHSDKTTGFINQLELLSRMADEDEDSMELLVRVRKPH